MFYKDYVSVYDKQVKAKKLIAKLSKTQDIEPLLYVDPKKAKTWWAAKWEENMKNYADFSNRINRGKTYVKNGFVIDFKINKGSIKGLVMGSTSKPYSVKIEIDCLKENSEKLLTETLKNKISNIDELIKGDFPKDLETLMLDDKMNLFPKPKEINFYCSCPDSAHMCKHVAAVLFGVGSKLSYDPLLFFELRGIDTTKLIKKSMDDLVSSMLINSSKPSKRQISAKDTLGLFGI